MPQEIDRIGRGHEWATRFFLLGSKDARSDMDRYLKCLPDSERKRVLVGSEKAAKKIISMNSGKIVEDVEVIGEESKKPGSEDFDLLIHFSGGLRKGYSLKIQKNFTGVNVRNPTLNSICKNFTGRNFEDFLGEEEVSKYEELGIAYHKGRIESKVLGEWGAEKLAEILNNELKNSLQAFTKTLLKEVRYKTNLVLTGVDASGKFLGHVTKFVDLFDDLIKCPKELRITSRGISVNFTFREKRLFHMDIYMMSDSKGKGKKLRAAIRVDFTPNEPTARI